MNILLVHQYYLEKNDGGGSRFNEMTAIWADKGHHITVLAGMVHYNTGLKNEKYRNKWFYKEEYTENIEVIRCHVSEAYNKNFLGRFWGYLSFTFFSIWAGLFKTGKKFDLILATSPPLFTGIVAIIISLFKRVPYVFEVRDLWPESAIDAGVLKNKLIIKLSYWMEAKSYRYAKIINVLTPAFRDTLINVKHIAPEKIIFIPNAADFNIAEHVSKDFNKELFKSEQGLSSDYFLITYVGAHGLANGLGLILETAKKLCDEPVLFLLIGTGMEKEKLVERAKTENINNVQFLDPVPKSEIFKFILASDAGASILIKAETFKTIYSNKTFDYMSCKKPVLLAIDGVSRELIETANCGLFVEPGNANDFAEKIKLYLEDRDMVTLHGENGYEYARKHFDRKVLAGKYLEELEKVVKGGRWKVEG